MNSSPDFFTSHSTETPNIDQSQQVTNSSLTNVTYKKLLDHANILIQSVNCNGEFIYVNEKWKDVLGYTEKEISTLKVWDIIRNDHREKCKHIFSQLFEGKEFASLETVFLNKSNKSVYVQGNITASKHDDTIVSTIGFFQDVTMEKNVNKEYEFLFNESCDALIIHDINTGQIHDVNKKMTELFGYTKEEALTLSFYELSSGNPPFTIETASIYAQKTVLNGPQTFKWQMKRKNGDFVWVEVTLKTIELHGKKLLLASLRDITQRVRIEQKLKENVKKFRLISTSAGDAIVMMDPYGKISYWNPAAENIFGYRKHEIIGKKLHETIAPQRYQEPFRKGFQTFQKTGDGVAVNKRLELQGLHKNGMEFPIELSLSSVQLDNEWHAIAIIRDITRRKENETKLQLFSEAVKQNPATIVITNEEGDIEYANPKFESTTGYSLEEVKGKNPRILKSGEQSEAFYQDLWQTITQGKTWHGEFHNRKKNGALYWEEAGISPIKDKEGNITHYVGIKEDITDKKQMISDLHIKENAIMSSINGMILIDLDGNVAFVNNAFLDIWNIESENEIVGKPAVGFWKKPGNYLDIIDKAIQGDGWLGELEAISSSRESFYVQLSASLVIDENDKPVYILNSVVDITQQKQLKEEFKKFKTISDKAEYGSLIHRKDGIITYANNAFASLHGYIPDELVGNHISMLFDSSESGKMISIHKDAEKHEGFKGREVYHKHKNGNFIPLLMSSTYIEQDDYNHSFFAETFVDISDLKKAQYKIQTHMEEVEMMNTELTVAREQLATLNKDLEKKVEQRTKEVEKLLKQKDGFINQLGHDLRTPLTPMLGLLPLLKKRVNDEKGLTYISMFDKNIRFMKELVNKTITFAKLNSDKIEFSFSQFKLIDFINTIQHQLQISLDDQHVHLDIDVSPELYVYADEMQLGEVFHNLLSNAIKYGPKDKDTVIRIQANQNEEDIVFISIEDNGIGMTQGQIENVFDEFYKADDSRSDIDSHGLGLNICKRIIEKHGGNIWVNSDGPGKGSEFQFTIRSTNGNWNEQCSKDSENRIKELNTMQN